MRFSLHVLLLLALAIPSLPAAAQTDPASTHRQGWPQILSGNSQPEIDEALALGPQLERGRSAKWLLADRLKLVRTLQEVRAQRADRVDAYVVSVALDSDPVFGREAREAAKVLTRRYDAAGHSIVLGSAAGAAASDIPNGSLESLTLALARVAELMDKAQDVLVLYITSHGAQVGIAYHDGDQGYGLLSPVRLAAILDELGIRNRMLILSACYSGVFLPVLSDENTAMFTAASSARTSFGCRAENDWTFFGDALINHGLRKPQPLEAASDEARVLIGEWEARGNLPPSDPQVSIGAQVSTWLAPLEARMPKTATPPVGAPATDALKGG